MRILHVVPWLTLRAGGTSVAVVGLARALKALGADVSIFTTDMAVPAHSEHLSRGVTIDDLPAGASELDIRMFPVNHPLRIVFSPQLQRALYRSSSDYDVVHIHSLFLHPQYAGWHAAHRSGKPYVVSPHGALDPYVRRKGKFRKQIVDVLWQRRMMENAAAIHLTTDDESRSIRDLRYRPPHVVIPNGLDTASFRSTDASSSFVGSAMDGPVILHHGRVSPVKGLDILVEALPNIRRIYPRARLVIVGPDDEGLATRLMNQSRELGVEGALNFTGPLSGADLTSAISSADLWVSPSHTENFGLAVVEAMAAGRPVIISPNVKISDAAREADAAEVVNNTPKDIARRILELLDDSARRQTLSENAERFARGYDWLSIGKIYLDMYDAVSREQ